MNDMRQWLDSLDLGQYAKAFAANDVDSRALGALTDDDLKEFGLSPGHRRVIQQPIAQLDDQPVLTSGGD
jgi:hypothetical protein